jgi:hypothetical protein
LTSLSRVCVEAVERCAQLGISVHHQYLTHARVRSQALPADSPCHPSQQGSLRVLRVLRAREWRLRTTHVTNARTPRRCGGWWHAHGGCASAAQGTTATRDGVCSDCTGHHERPPCVRRRKVVGRWRAAGRERGSEPDGSVAHHRAPALVSRPTCSATGVASRRVRCVCGSESSQGAAHRGEMEISFKHTLAPSPVSPGLPLTCAELW